MKIGIIAAMPEELKILVENLENAEKHLRLGHVYHTGSIGRHEVVLVESGIGKVMSAMKMSPSITVMMRRLFSLTYRLRFLPENQLL